MSLNLSNKKKLKNQKRIFISQNVDKKGIFYTIQRLPDKLHKRFEKFFDKKNQNWWFQRDEFAGLKKLLKKKGYKISVAEIQRSKQSLDDLLSTSTNQNGVRRIRTPYRLLNELMGRSVRAVTVKVKKNGKWITKKKDKEFYGFPCGSITLIGGDAGVGKSTLTNQLLLFWAEQGKRVIYINTEESRDQVRDRFIRLNERQPFSKTQRENLISIVVKDVDMIREDLKNENADVVVLDSVGGLVESQGAARGGTKVLREASMLVADYVKWNNPKAVAIMIGHVNQAGRIAGPKAMQHAVDIVLFMQGSGAVRTIQPFKNRYGATTNLISVEMSETGLGFDEAQAFERDVQAHEAIAHVEQG